MTHKIAKSVFALLIAIGLVITVSYATAQSSVSGSISGTVSDATGAVVSGATVTITNVDRGEDLRVTKTNGAGFFTAESLPLGNYKVTIVGSHFKTEVVTGLVLHAADELTVNRALTPGGANEIVTVTATDNLVNVNLEDATSAGLINNEQITQMPLITRNYETLINLQPGVAWGGASDVIVRGPVSLSGSSSTVAFSVNGGRTTQNNWTVDGADNLDRGANLTLYTFPSPDAIAEFKTLRGQYSAQFGRNAAGQVDVVTKGGQNAIHGSAYEYLRNDYFDAAGYLRDFQYRTGAVKTPIDKYRYNDFGFSFGGPVYIPKIYNGHNKTFFFVSEDWWREITYTTGTAIVPTAAERKGDFSNSGFLSGSTWTTGPVNVCTAFTNNASGQTNSCTAAGTQVTTISPTAQAYLKDIYSIIPTPNSAADLTANIDPHSVATTLPNRYNDDDTVVRIDQQVGQKLSVFYRYLHDTYPFFIGAGTFVAVPIPGLSATVNNNPGTEHMAKGTYLFSPTLLANIGYAYSNGSVLTTPQGALLSSQSKDINIPEPYANTVGVVPGISFTGMTSLGGSVVYIDHGVNHQAFGDVTKVLHNHTLIAGMSYSHYQKQENSTTGDQGTFSFTTDVGFTNFPSLVTDAAVSGKNEAQAFANFLTGNANGSPGFTQKSANIAVNIQSNLYEGFLQDNWKVQPRLTLNLGVRYSYFGQPWDANNRLNSFLPSSYSAAKAPTIANNGLICLTGTCSQTNSSAGQSTSPNANADYVGVNYINGLIFGTPSSLNNNQASPYGNKVGQAGKWNFAPRFGFAYDLFGNGKTSLRGGYGWSFDQVEVSYYETTAFSNPPAVSTYSASQALFDNPAGGATSTTISTSPARIQALPLNYQTPYVQQFSLDLQQELAPKFILDLGYFGNRGTHLMGGLNINEPKPGSWMGVVTPTSVLSTCLLNGQPALISGTCDRVLHQIQPYIGYDAVDAMRSIFNSNYNSMQVKATKRFNGRSFIDVNYTWSRDLGNAQSDYSGSGFAQNIYNINGDYGRATVDRGQVFNLDGVFDEPWFREQRDLKGRLLGGWELGVIYSANSGLPNTVTESTGGTIQYNFPGGTSIYNNQANGGVVTDNAGLNTPNTTSTSSRPNQIGDPNTAGNAGRIHNKAYQQATSPWFYSGAFAAAPYNSPVPGNTKRGTVQGPGFQRLDLGIYRNFRIWEHLNFQLRGEAMNAFNHTNVNSIGVSATTSTFGEVTGYRDPRIMQLSGRFDF